MDEPVVAQVAAYNAHDVDGFVACYTSGQPMIIYGRIGPRS